MSVLPRQQILDLYRDAVKSGLSIEDVQKEINDLHQLVSEVQVLQRRDERLTTKYWRTRKIVPLVLITLGSILMANAIWPILYHTVFVAPHLKRVSLLSPVPIENIIEETRSSSSIAKVEASDHVSPIALTPRPRPIILSEQLDYTNLANWFTDATMIQTYDQVEEKEFYVDVPSLNVEKAVVKIGGTDLNRSLIQYPSTADPGNFGAPVIFGHSVLPQFYRPGIDNPNRYKSIFTKLGALEIGERIYVTYDGVKYTYRVYEKQEVHPEDTFILEQRHSARELKLVTCTPAGTYLRRLVVVAVLEDVE